MFKSMPKIFWIGTGFTYGWILFFMCLEMSIPGFPLKKLFGIPCCYIYNWMFALWINNLVVAWIYVIFEEKRDRTMLERKGGSE
ncbi:MAG: hypothetical protein R6U68_12235 [Desulfobacteraceae bacterium]